MIEYNRTRKHRDGGLMDYVWWDLQFSIPLMIGPNHLAVHPWNRSAITFANVHLQPRVSKYALKDPSNLMWLHRLPNDSGIDCVTSMLITSPGQFRKSWVTTTKWCLAAACQQEHRGPKVVLVCVFPS